MYDIISKADIRSNRRIALETNIIHYQGASCKYGHNGFRYTKSGGCVKCREYKPTGGKVGGKPNIKKQLAAIANEKYFYPDIPCKRCGTSKRYTKSSICFKCQKSYRNGKERQYSLAKFNLSVNQYNEMLKSQNYVCFICKEPEQRVDPKTKKIKNLAVDHCHKTNKIRGLLCHHCNVGIGNFKDNPDLLRAAALYCEAAKND